MISRLQRNVCLFLAAGVSVALATAAWAQAEKARPNFLFVYLDDMRWDAMSVVQREQGEHARFPWLHTPNMDRLAEQGVRFRNAFVTTSLCSPSRAAFLTGRYNHFNGVASNQVPFPVDNATHATLLRAAGYTTAYIGKWHMAQQRGQRPGFDYSASFVGQGRYEDWPFEINGVSTPTKGWVDDVATDYAVDFLRQKHPKPFSLVVGFKAPHIPFSPPERARARFAGEVARPVPNVHAKTFFTSKGDAALKDPPPPGQATWHLDYFRCISAIDDCLGRLLAALDETGLAPNTVVVFSSDNGYVLGEHGLGPAQGDKRTAYEASLRIPMLVRFPGRVPANATKDDLVLNIDLAPTLLDLAGVAVPATVQGRSWQPLFSGHSAGWRTAFLYEYFFENMFAETPVILAARTTNAKLIVYPDHPARTELFDLIADPYETVNLVGDPTRADLLAAMQAELERQKKLTGFLVPDYAERPGAPLPAKGKKKNSQ